MVLSVSWILTRAPFVMLAVFMVVGLSARAAPAPEAGADTRVLTLQAAVDAAVQGHPLLRNARAQVRKAGASIDAAQAGYFPSVKFGINSQLNDDAIPDYDSHYVNEAELSVSQLLYDFGRIDSKVDRAKAKRRLAKIRVQQAYAKVVRNTASTWIKVRKYQALAEVAKEQLEAVKALAKLSKRREALGASTHSDTAQAKARVEAARAQLLTKRAQVRRWRNTLMHWVGTSEPPRVTGTPPPRLARACRRVDGRRASRQAVSVRIARGKLSVARAAEDVAATRMRPTLKLNATASRGLGSHSQRIGESGTDLGVTLNASVPLYQGGRLRSNQRAAEYGVQAARAALQQARLAATRGLQSAMVQWQRYRGLRQVQQQREHSMRVTRQLYRKQYLKLGTRSLLDLLNAEQEYYGVISDQIQSKYQMYDLGVTCLNYTGQLDDTFNTGINTRFAIGSIDAVDAQGTSISRRPADNGGQTNLAISPAS